MNFIRVTSVVSRIYSLILATGTLLLSAFVVVAKDELPNIILVMADDQGWGDMAYSGHPHLKTPNFDAMAREAVRFDNFYAAAPVCSPTRGSVLTGRTPNRYGCYSWGHPIRPQETTIAEALKGAGYRTGHFGKWHIGSVQKESPVNPGASGFDVWVSSPNFFDIDPILSEQGKAVPYKGESSEITVDVALKFIRESVSNKERFLAVVWFGSPHSPHQSLPADRKLYESRPENHRDFLAEITAMDRAFGKLRSELRELGIRENTLLWYCSDNGALPKVGSSGGRRGNKGHIYEGGLLVPGLLEWPAKFKTPALVTMPAVTSDIYPTVLKATGVKVKNQPPLDGINLLPHITAKKETRPQPIGFWSYPSNGIRTPAREWMQELYEAQKAGRSVDDPEKLYVDADQIKNKLSLKQFPGHSAWLDNSWKLHRIEDGAGAITWELYDLAKDPKESRDLSTDENKRATKMGKDLERWLLSVARSQNGDDYK